ncbi:MAG TPA: hypothetical protein PKK94_21975, partial [Leptospiraceae bacterium]|nr:hypothetical protein [Leptospiraceae bacterium]
MPKSKILIVEDDDSLGATLKERLSRESYLARLVNTVQKAYSEIQEFRPDLIILDLLPPEIHLCFRET